MRCTAGANFALRAGPVGVEVTTTATCVAYTNRSLTCAIQIHLADVLVAEGSVTHAAMPVKFFEQRQRDMRKSFRQSERVSAISLPEGLTST